MGMRGQRRTSIGAAKNGGVADDRLAARPAMKPERRRSGRRLVLGPRRVD